MQIRPRQPPLPQLLSSRPRSSPPITRRLLTWLPVAFRPSIPRMRPPAIQAPRWPQRLTRRRLLLPNRLPHPTRSTTALVQEFLSRGPATQRPQRRPIRLRRLLQPRARDQQSERSLCRRVCVAGSLRGSVGSCCDAAPAATPTTSPKINPNANPFVDTENPVFTTGTQPPPSTQPAANVALCQRPGDSRAARGLFVTVYDVAGCALLACLGRADAARFS